MTTPDRNATILVVDDNPPTRYSTSRVLRSAGFAVVEAATGGEALARASSTPDLIVLDVNLPDMDGFEVCRRLRATPRTARTPVIHLSASFVKDVDRVQGLDAGANGYITHPVEPPVLIATVNAFLRASRAEDAMRASEVKFKAVFEQALDGIALFSHEMIFLEVNPAICATLGRDRPAIIGKHLSVFNTADSAPVLAEITSALDATGAWRGTLPVLRADGRRIELEWSVSIHSLPGIRLAITTDVTTRREIEAERERLLASERAARAEAERANQLKDDFLAALSHELRTPLNAIVGWSQVLKQRVGSGDSDLSAGVSAIERNARVQAQLIADLLDVSRVTSGKLQLDRQWIDPVDALASAIATVQDAASRRSIAITLHVEARDELILWDPSRFQQVAWNLIDNAVKFSPEGGRVEVALTSAPAHLQLSIRDSGRGISPEFLPHVFDPFRQEASGTKRWHGGLGLGLAIVRQLVDAHGGTVEVHSLGENLGATFTVSLPSTPRQHIATATAVVPEVPAPALPSLSGARVLVVEDDADARTLLRRILLDADADVVDVDTVDAAVAQIAEVKPDLLISDIGMPHQDGYDLIRRLRASGYGVDALPAIALTAFAREEDRARALAAGYQAHLSKPVETRQLLTLAADLLRRGRARG